MHGKLASDHPEWKWTMMWKSWEYLCDGVREAAYTDPDNFGMYVYNDFHGYGVLSLAERQVCLSLPLTGDLLVKPLLQLVNFNKEYVKKDPSVHAMWSIVAMMGHWLLHGNIDGVWSSVDDGERVAHMHDLIGCALLTALNFVDRTEQLKPASKFPDLALVMSLYLYWAKGREDYGIDEDELEWRKNVVAYAKKGNLDLDTISCGKIKEELQRLSDVDPVKGSTNAGRWHWPKKVRTERYSILETNSKCFTNSSRIKRNTGWNLVP
jgi:hypothetical protein